MCVKKVTNFSKFFRIFLRVFQVFLCSFWDVVVVENLPKPSNPGLYLTSLNFAPLYAAKSLNGLCKHCVIIKLPLIMLNEVEMKSWGLPSENILKMYRIKTQSRFFYLFFPPICQNWNRKLIFPDLYRLPEACSTSLNLSAFPPLFVCHAHFTAAHSVKTTEPAAGHFSG